MKRVVPVAVGLAAGMAVGFFLGAMVTRHDEPIVVIHNATDETLRWVSIQTDFHPANSDGRNIQHQRIAAAPHVNHATVIAQANGVESGRYHSRWQKAFEREG